jgi:hypothetical protein
MGVLMLDPTEEETPMIQLSTDWCRDYDDYRAAQDAEEGARMHDALEGDYSNADTAPDADIPF